MTTAHTTISKSGFIRGLQCPKALWLGKYRKDLEPPVAPALQAIFDAGHEIGSLAQATFPGGVEISSPYWNIAEGEEETRRWIAEGRSTIYEATAINPESGAYCRIDILNKCEDGQSWDLIEVKSSSSVKDYHIDDLAFQAHVFRAAGYAIHRCYLMHVDTSYEREGEIEPDKLLKPVDVTEAVNERAAFVTDEVERLVSVLKEDQEPVVQISSHCKKPFDCAFKAYCWRDVPEYSIFNILTSAKADQFVQRTGNYALEDLTPGDIPTGLKGMDLEAHKTGQSRIDRAALQGFVSELKFPIYHLDYETIQSAVPLYQGTRPFQQIPFQFSLHVQHDLDAEPVHVEFLHFDRSDPREPLLETLVGVLGAEGTILVYNQSFEVTRNKELAKGFPRYAKAINRINGRVMDLMLPFQKRWAYHPDQAGSFSIKKVLPAFTDLSYDQLEIASGDAASSAYLAFQKGTDDESDRERLKRDLLKYCALDTYAMVLLLKEVYRLAETG